MLEPFTYAFAQRGVLEILLLSAGAGILGTWIVLRGLAFYSHAVAAASFPGLVLAAGLGLAPLAGALGAAAVVALGVGGLSARRHAAYDAATALVLVGALALGVILASDVFHSGSEVDTLLFGSLFAIGTTDLAFAAAASLAALVATLLIGQRWLAVGFDPPRAGALATDLALLALVAFTSVAALAAVGALLATALLVIPAVTTRLWTNRMRSWQLATVALTAAEGVAGVWLSVRTNAPPGATIATIGGAVFVVAVLVSKNKSRYRQIHVHAPIDRLRRARARRRPAGVRG